MLFEHNIKYFRHRLCLLTWAHELNSPIQFIVCWFWLWQTFDNWQLLVLCKEMCIVLRGNRFGWKRSSSWTLPPNSLPTPNPYHHYCSKVGRVLEPEIRASHLQNNGVIDFWPWERSTREFCLPPVLCLQGVLLLKVCVYNKSDVFYHCFWAQIWSDRLQSMCALLEKQMYVCH